MLTLALSSIIIVLISQVLLGAFQSSNQVQNHSQLRQEANLILTMLRAAHENSTDRPYLIQTVNNEGNVQLEIDGQLTPANVHLILELKDDTGQSFFASTKEGTSAEITISPRTSILTVTRIALFDHNGQQQYETSTLIRRTIGKDFRRL